MSVCKSPFKTPFSPENTSGSEPASPLLSFRCQHGYPSGFRLDVQFDVDCPFTALFGPSGSGKTSLLNMIAGLLRPQQGTIRLGNRVLLDTARRVSLPPEKRHVGVVFQDSLLFPHLTVEGNLRYGQRRRNKRTRPLDFARVVEVLEIGPLLQRSPHSLSGGERQRVALGRALLSGPELLLMDEPLASLDAPLRMKVLAYLERVVGEWNIPTLYVTHSQAEVRRAAGWVIVLDKGRIAGSGKTEEVLGQTDLLTWGNSMAPVNLVRLDRVERSEDQLKGWIGDQVLSLPPRPSSDAEPKFVQFSPASVIVSKQDVVGLSARNRLRGRVCRMASHDQAVFVAIDIGQVIWAEVTPASASELDLKPGVEVICLLKTYSLSLVD
jgi:molybdate transport system ATP-binding protein